MKTRKTFASLDFLTVDSKSTIKKFIKVTFCLVLFFIVTPAFGRENLSVDFDTIVQENFLGVNAVYHAFTYMPESIEQGMTDDLRKIELDRIEEIGLHIARTFYRPDWAMGEGVWTAPNWDSIKMKALYAWLNDMKERNVDVALNMGWWFSRDVIWNRDQHLPTYPDDMQKYVEWVSESLHQIIELRGFTNVKYIVMFTEPGNRYGDIPHAKKNWDYYKEVLKETHKRLAADGRRHLVKIIGPNTTQAPRWVEKAVVDLNDVIDIYSSHNYNFDTYQKWYDLAVEVREACKSSGKPFWIDEYGFQDFRRRRDGEYGNLIAQVNAAFMNAGAQSSLIWILNDQYYPYPLKHITNGDAFLDGKHSWGLYPWLPESRTVRPAWHSFKLLSRLMGGEGTKVYATKGTDTLHISAAKLPDENVSILLVNGADTNQEFGIHLSELLNKPVYRYLYDPAEMPVSKSGGVGSGGVISGRIPAKGVLIYSTINDNGLSVKSGSPEAPKYDENTEGNLAFLKKVTLSGRDFTLSAQNLTDGKRLTYWEPETTVAGVQEIVLDLELLYKIRQIDVYMGEKNLAASKNFSGNIVAFVSRDGKEWVSVPLDKKKERPDNPILSFISSGNSAGRYVRFSYDQPKGAGRVDHGSRISEIKVYGASQGN